ncbi:phage tail assembly chaperone G [Paraclostridium sordellii]|uniref:phage tail assembly chaperone G n=2 Tax=Paraclostridium sordellii TaxID=1505 RepID=UPI0030CC4B34
MKITVKKKEYDSGKILRNKYKKFTEVRDRLSQKEGYTDEDLGDMIDVLVIMFDNQFTAEDIDLEFDVPEIIYNFMRADIEIAEKLDRKIEETNKLFMKDKK